MGFRIKQEDWISGVANMYPKKRKEGQNGRTNHFYS